MFRHLVPIVLLACAAPPRAVEGDEGEGPKLVVLVVIDQLPTWSFDERVPLLKHGLARIIREGVYRPNVQYPYAATFTAVGHAAVATGAPPSTTGILANKWWDRGEGRLMESVEDPSSPILPVRADGPPPARGVSPRRLRVDTVGDALKRAYPRARVVSISFKDRSAVLLGGHEADLAVWYDPRQKAFTTSLWYREAPPDWLIQQARTQNIAQRLKDYVWTPLDAKLLAEFTGIPDDSPGEKDIYGMGIVFPHRLGASKIPAEDVEATPLSDELVLETILGAIEHEQLGADSVPDLLAVSFSANDNVAHTYGQESWESLDELLRLDGRIGALLEALDAQVGAGRWALVLTSDHGGARTVEQSVARGRPALRVNPEAVEAAAERAASAIAGAGDWIDYARDPTIYLSAAAQALPPEKREPLLDAVVDAVAAIRGIGYTRRSDRMLGDCDARPELDALICRSLDPERSGEIFYGPSADSVIMLPPDEATSHGSANPDDRMVPVMVLSPTLHAGRPDETASILQVAPTVAKLLGVAPPAFARKPPLI